MEMPQKNLPNEGPQDQDIEQMLFSAPIPGEGLTSDPSTPKPWERPPEFTKLEDAQEYLFEKVMENGEDFVELMAKGITIEHLATTIVMQGFTEGKWNPDLLLLLIEPTMYILLFICEQAGVDYVLSDEQEAEYLEPEGQRKMNKHLSEAVKKTANKVKENTASTPPSENLPASLLAGEM